MGKYEDFRSKIGLDKLVNRFFPQKNRKTVEGYISARIEELDTKIREKEGLVETTRDEVGRLRGAADELRRLQWICRRHSQEEPDQGRSLG